MIRMFVVDSFTNNVFSGNPAAVCLLEKDLSDSLKGKIAAEMNLSETAFVTLNSEGTDTFQTSSSFGLRWFTPSCEVPLCGHATLAAAAVIFHKYGNPSNVIEFQTLSGILKSRREDSSMITLDFPINPPYEVEVAKVDDIVRVCVGHLEVDDVKLSPTTKKLLIRLADKYTRQDIEKLAPSTQAMMSAQNDGIIKGIIITLRSNLDIDGYDFYSRYFAPWVGIPEDPVTGSAHTVLAPYWQTVYGKQEFKARQCSPRGGDLIIKIVDQRVELSGQVAHVLEGTMRIE